MMNHAAVPSSIGGPSVWRLRVLALALMTSVFLVSGRAEALGFPVPPPGGGQQATPPAGGGPVPTDDAPPKVTPQDCFDQLARNQKKCKTIHCDEFWFFLWWNNCSSAALGTCMDAAQEVYDCCIIGDTTPPCGDGA